MTIFIHF